MVTSQDHFLCRLSLSLSPSPPFFSTALTRNLMLFRRCRWPLCRTTTPRSLPPPSPRATNAECANGPAPNVGGVGGGRRGEGSTSCLRSPLLSKEIWPRSITTTTTTARSTRWVSPSPVVASLPLVEAARRGAFALISERLEREKDAIDLSDPNVPEQAAADEIMRRLTRAERWIVRAPDYGSLYVCQLLNEAKVMLDDIEEALVRRGFAATKPELLQRIAAARTQRLQTLYDLDLL